jgi:outer membrane protein assembly factor BamB
VAIAALVLACHARASAQQTPAAPVAKGFDVAWSQELGSPGSVSIAVSASRVFVADTETGVAAHSAADGLLVWMEKLPSPLAPVVAGDQVFIVSGGRVHARDEATGREKWARDLGEGAAALAANGTGVLAAAGRVLRAWSADGVPAWQRELQADVAPDLVAVDAGLAYVGLANSTLTAIDVATGEVRWHKRLATLPRAFAAGGGRLYFGGADHALHAYSRGGGTPWKFRRVDTIGAPALDDRFVFVVLWDNTALAFDRGNGKRKWRTALPARPARGPWVLGEELAVPLVSGAIVLLDRKTGVPQPAPKTEPTERPRDRLLAAAPSVTGHEVFEVLVLVNNSRLLVARRRIT